MYQKFLLKMKIFSLICGRWFPSHEHLKSKFLRAQVDLALIEKDIESSTVKERKSMQVESRSVKLRLVEKECAYRIERVSKWNKMGELCMSECECAQSGSMKVSQFAALCKERVQLRRELILRLRLRTASLHPRTGRRACVCPLVQQVAQQP